MHPLKMIAKTLVFLVLLSTAAGTFYKLKPKRLYKHLLEPVVDLAFKGLFGDHHGSDDGKKSKHHHSKGTYYGYHYGGAPLPYYHEREVYLHHHGDGGSTHPGHHCDEYPPIHHHHQHHSQIIEPLSFIGGQGASEEFFDFPFVRGVGDGFNDNYVEEY